MTKKEMIYEIISNTKIHSINENDVLRVIKASKKEKVTEIYNAFLKDKEHANFYYYAVMCYQWFK